VKEESADETVSRMTGELRERLFQKKRAFFTAHKLLKVPQSPHRRQLTHDEFRHCLGPEGLNAGFSDRDVRKLIGAVDREERGHIESHGFIRMVLQPEASPAKAPSPATAARSIAGSEGTIRREGTMARLREAVERDQREAVRLSALRRGGSGSELSAERNARGRPSSSLFRPRRGSAGAAPDALQALVAEQQMGSSSTSTGGDASSSSSALLPAVRGALPSPKEKQQQRSVARARRKLDAERRIRESGEQRDLRAELQNQAKLTNWAKRQLSVVERSTEMDKQTFIRSLYTGKGGVYGSNIYAQRNYNGSGSLW
jgi:hypothetical protein